MYNMSYFGNCLIPDLNCPEDNSKLQKEELDQIANNYHNPNLSKDFLKIAHNSGKKVFKNYLKNNNLEFDWKKIKPVLKEVEKVTHKLKKKYSRKRPKFYLLDRSDSFKDIEKMGSFSFPSGHTTTAYFISKILGEIFPNHSTPFNDIAMLIGQSRIENAVHYPSDVWAGQLLGETLANSITSIDYKDIPAKIERKDEKNYVKELRKLASKYYPKLSKKQQIENYAEDLTQFIEQSNKIEHYNTDECFTACLKFILGYPIIYCTDDSYISSHLKMLVASHKSKKVESCDDFLYVHSHIGSKVLESGYPGALRTAKATSNSGNQYSDPNQIVNYCNQLKDCKNPFLKHILFEWIHPFQDGNGRSGRCILASDLNYDFEKVVSFCGRDYINRIENFTNHHKKLSNIFN